MPFPPVAHAHGRHVHACPAVSELFMALPIRQCVRECMRSYAVTAHGIAAYHNYTTVTSQCHAVAHVHIRGLRGMVRDGEGDI